MTELSDLTDVESSPVEADLDTPPSGLADGAAADEGPGELTEAQLEALLFVAERPLSRREIASMARVEEPKRRARLRKAKMIHKADEPRLQVLVPYL